MKENLNETVLPVTNGTGAYQIATAGHGPNTKLGCCIVTDSESCMVCSLFSFTHYCRGTPKVPTLSTPISAPLSETVLDTYRIVVDSLYRVDKRLHSMHSKLRHTASSSSLEVPSLGKVKRSSIRVKSHHSKKRVSFQDKPTILSIPAIHWVDYQESHKSLRRARREVEEVAETDELKFAVLHLMKSYKRNATDSSWAECFLIQRHDLVRGLEQRAVPILKCVRVRTVKMLVKFSNEAYRCYDSETASRLVREKAVQYSRPSVQLAYILGKIDQQVVRDLLRSDVSLDDT